jgi:exocyst complex component 7
MTSTPHNLRDLETACGATLGNPLAEDQVFDPVHPEAINDLRMIADQMVHTGYARELADAYCSIHRGLLDEYLSVLDVERLSIDEVQRVEWKLLNDARGQDHRVRAARRRATPLRPGALLLRAA